MKSLAISTLFLLFAFSSALSKDKEVHPIFAFVGEKISVEALPHEAGSMDNAFRAKYRVVEVVHGDLKHETVEFKGYDHMRSMPAFADYDHALMYVVLVDGEFYHSKYMYSPLFKTNDGRWAGPYEFADYSHEYNKGTSIVPVEIDFPSSATRELSKWELEYMEKKELEPYFRLDGNKLIPLKGNYVKELFELKKNGYLKARGYFE